MVETRRRLTASAGFGTHEEGGECVADDADADTDADADADTDTDTDADSDTDTPAACTVSEDGSALFTSIQDAVDAASDGDIINVCAGVYSERVSLSRGAVSIVGVDGAEVTVIDAGFLGTALAVENGADESTRIADLALPGDRRRKPGFGV